MIVYPACRHPILTRIQPMVEMSRSNCDEWLRKYGFLWFIYVSIREERPIRSLIHYSSHYWWNYWNISAHMVWIMRERIMGIRWEFFMSPQNHTDDGTFIRCFVGDGVGNFLFLLKKSWNKIFRGFCCVQTDNRKFSIHPRFGHDW